MPDGYPDRALLFGRAGRVVQVIGYRGKGCFWVLEARPGRPERKLLVHRDRLTFVPNPPSSSA